jgi:hypothetical protein
MANYDSRSSLPAACSSQRAASPDALFPFFITGAFPGCGVPVHHQPQMGTMDPTFNPVITDDSAEFALFTVAKRADMLFFTGWRITIVGHLFQQLVALSELHPLTLLAAGCLCIISRRWERWIPRSTRSLLTIQPNSRKKRCSLLIFGAKGIFTVAKRADMLFFTGWRITIVGHLFQR